MTDTNKNFDHLSGTIPSEKGRKPKHILRQNERLSDAPPANTQIPDVAKQEATLDELLSYYPNHCLTWPGLAMVSTLASYTYASNVINKARGSLGKTEKNQHTPRTNVRYYTRLALIDHLRVNDIPYYSEESLKRHLESFLWDAPSKISDRLQPPWSLGSIGQGIENHPNGSFANLVKASLEGFNLPRNQLYSRSSTHRVIDFAIARRGNKDNVREVLEEIRGKSNGQSDGYSASAPVFDENGEPLNMDRLKFVQQHYQFLKQQALLWVLKEMNSRQVARELKKVRPDIVKNEEQYAAMLRKRKEKVLQCRRPQTGIQRSVPIKTIGKGQRFVLFEQADNKNVKDCHSTPSAVMCPSITCDILRTSIRTETDMESFNSSTASLVSSNEATVDETDDLHQGISPPIPVQMISNQISTGQIILDQISLGRPIPDTANELKPGQAIDITNLHSNMLAGTTIVKLPDRVSPGPILYDTPMVEDHEGDRIAEEIFDTIMDND